jgi:hypothetical protein
MRRGLSMSGDDEFGVKPSARRWLILVPLGVFLMSFSWGLFWFELSEHYPIFAVYGSPTGGFEEGYLAALGAFVGSIVGAVIAGTLLHAGYRPRWFLWAGLLLNVTFGAVVLFMAC